MGNPFHGYINVYINAWIEPRHPQPASSWVQTPGQSIRQLLVLRVWQETPVNFRKNWQNGAKKNGVQQQRGSKLALGGRYAQKQSLTTPVSFCKRLPWCLSSQDADRHGAFLASDLHLQNLSIEACMKFVFETINIHLPACWLIDICKVVRTHVGQEVQICKIRN